MTSIYHRTSIRKFLEKEVEEEKIIEILKAGMQAPSATNQQPWIFYVVTNKEKIQELSEVSPYGAFASKASAIIVPCYKLEGLRAPSFAQIDMSICMENMWLRTDELGLGGTWIGIAPMQEKMDAVEKVLDLEEDMHAFCLYAIGYPDEEKVQQDRFDESRIHFVR